MSIIAQILCIAFIVMRTIKLFADPNPQVSMILETKEIGDIDLWKLNFFFAVDDIDPRVGTLKVTATEWDQDGKTKTKVEMRSCSDFITGG